MVALEGIEVYGRAVASPIRILIADDEAVLRSAVADLIAADHRFELVGQARDADEAISLAETTQPDIALIDVRMPKGGGIPVAEELRSRSPQTRVLANTAVDDRSTVVRMLELGAVGYLVKGTPPSEIITAIKRASRGQQSVSPQVMSGMVADLSHRLQREESEARGRDLVTERINAAIAGEDRWMAYQPIIELERGSTIGYEALARFEVHDVEWEVDRWFSEAKRVGLSVDLELACIRSALEALRHLPLAMFVGVNASQQTSESEALLATLGTVDGARVVVEITEHEAVEDYSRLTEAFGRFRERGIRVAIDDAGAGFASLRHILLIEPELIKLDISLTRGIDVDPRRRALARALASFATELGIDVLAEGIETEQEMGVLRDLGVQLGQGYFLGRPAPLERWLAVG